MEFRKKIILITYSDLKSRNRGDSVNDFKLFKAIKKKYKVLPIYPSYRYPSIYRSILHFYQIFRVSLKKNQIFVCRSTLRAIFPVLFKRIRNHHIILYFGCTPFFYLEDIYFAQNLEYPKLNYIQALVMGARNVIYAKIDQWLLKYTDYYLVENTKAKNFVKNHGGILHKGILLPYFVNDYFSDSITKLQYNPTMVFKIGYTGRFQKYDKLKPLLEALKILKSDNARITLYLVGDGPTKKDIEFQIKELEISEMVVFLGLKPHKELSHIIEDFHCLVLPMIESIFPSTIAIKILEGIIKGKVIITNRSGNNASLFQTNRDLLLKIISAEEIAQKIKMVMENFERYQDLALLNREQQLKIHNQNYYTQTIINLLSNWEQS